jgi:hypothetical protein
MSVSFRVVWDGATKEVALEAGQSYLLNRDATQERLFFDGEQVHRHRREGSNEIQLVCPLDRLACREGWDGHWYPEWKLCPTTLSE